MRTLPSWIVILAAFVVCFVVTALTVPARFGFSPDSWSYFDLAESFWRHPYQAWGLRQFQSVTPYSNSFPPLWPLVLVPFVRVAGIWGTYIAALLAYAGFAAASEALSHRWFSRRGIGLLSATLLFAFSGVQGELAGGRSIPLALMWLALIALEMPRGAREPRHAAVYGMLIGASVMTRFDALPSALVFLAGLLWLGAGARLFTYACGAFVLVISPWIVYSIAHFHTPFATDNSATALAATYTFVLDFHANRVPTLFDAPRQWLAKLLHAAATARSALRQAIADTFFVPILLALVAVGIVIRGSSSRERPGRSPFLPRDAYVTLAAVAAAFVAFYVPGYFDWRYFTSSFWLIELVALAYIARELPRHFDIVACLVAVSCVAVLSWPLSRSPRLIDAAYLRDVADRHDVDSLRTCLLRDGANARDLAVFSHDVERLTT